MHGEARVFSLNEDTRKAQVGVLLLSIADEYEDKLSGVRVAALRYAAGVFLGVGVDDEIEAGEGDAEGLREAPGGLARAVSDLQDRDRDGCVREVDPISVMYR